MTDSYSHLSSIFVISLISAILNFFFANNSFFCTLQWHKYYSRHLRHTYRTLKSGTWAHKLLKTITFIEQNEPRTIQNTGTPQKNIACVFSHVTTDQSLLLTLKLC